MRVLVVGSGGREHALALKLAESALVDRLSVAPGNGGTEARGWNIPIDATDIATIVDFAYKEAVDLVVVGPEAPLALGLADALAERSSLTGRQILCFGPGRLAARLESSKAFSKDMMWRLGIPTAAYRNFSGPDDFEAAAEFMRRAPWPLVVKGSGLASGKGVFLPSSVPEAIGLVHELLRGGMLGTAGSELVIEERLDGEEFSILAFCDGTRIAVMPGAQDHKRLLDGDQGPNTGGMGAYAPACPPERAAEYARIAIEPVVRDLAASGMPFIGVIYAGIIVTSQGPRVLEYNCRFGDPEAQAILALFDGDLAATLAACASGDIRSAMPVWKSGAAACVVMASEGYPEAPVGGVRLAGLEPEGSAYVLHAGTELDAGVLVSRTGRVLGVVAYGPDLREALSSAYAKVDAISFPGARFRRDIGARGLATLAREDRQLAGSAYAASGVDIDAGNEAVRRMAGAVRATYTDAVLSGIGSFGGLWDAASLAGMAAPVLVGSTDGVGTKVKLAAQAKSYRSIGMDIVNHCIDDILVQGARPLFFLDYFASSRIDPGQVAQAVGGMAAACQSSGCVLLGGETAEMPGVYQPGEFDIAGTIVGVVERVSILPSAGIGAGDVLVGFRSDGPHTNGYSLVRMVFDGIDLSTVYPELGAPLGQVLLAPHRSYLPLLWPILRDRPGLIKGLAHLTGGGFVENVPRILPAGLEAVIERGRWPVPPLYRLMERLGRIEPDEMYRVFNMGIGMVAVVEHKRADELVAAAGEECWIVGHLAATGTAEAARTRLA